MTALRCVRLGGALVGSRVLITGGAGGVGTLAIQIAACSGAHVTAVVGRAERAAGLNDLGAREVVQGIENTTGRFALILESGGGTSLTEAVRRIEPNGTVVVYGNSSAEPSTISFQDFRMAQNARIQSFFYFTSGPEELFAPDLSLLVSLIADGDSVRSSGLSATGLTSPRSLKSLRHRQVAGKAVFTIGA